jgi:glycosyltransferase involved in cell wall biosynthesis
MGFGNCVLVRNSNVNMEVIENYGCSFDREHPEESLAEKIRELVLAPEKVVCFRKNVTLRVKSYYNWEWIADFYEDLFSRMQQKNELLSYEEYLETKTCLT